MCGQLHGPATLPCYEFSGEPVGPENHLEAVKQAEILALSRIETGDPMHRRLLYLTRDQLWTVVNTGSITGGEFLGKLSNYQLVKKNSAPWS